MSKPSCTSRATDFAKPSFEDFSTTVLEQWTTEAELGGLVVTSPRVAAGRAAYEASVIHARKKGVVLVVAHDGSSARSCFDYLRAYFTDQEQLAGLAKAVTSDTITLRAGPSILVTSDATRRPKGLLASIALVLPVLSERIDLRDMARTICEIVRKDPASAEEMGRLIGFSDFFTDGARRAAARPQEPLDWQPAKASTMPSALPLSLHPRAAEFGVPTFAVDGVDYYSEQWETWNANRKMSGGARRAPLVRRTRPRGDPNE